MGQTKKSTFKLLFYLKKNELKKNGNVKHRNKYKVQPKFYVINFDDPRKSHRCNPLNPDL